VPSSGATNNEPSPSETRDTDCPLYRRIVACVDQSRCSRQVIPHGVALASALRAELVLLHVLETDGRTGAPLDPIDWDLWRREADQRVAELAHERSEEVEHIEAAVLEGHAADQICQWAQDHQADLTVLCSHGSGDTGEWDLGSTARRVLDCAPGSVLIVPARTGSVPRVEYRRILLPLDGSSRAESGLPIAVQLAEAHSAELVIAHVIPEAELTEIGPLEPEAIELRQSILRRNERIGREYLERMRAMAANRGLATRTLLLDGSDVRRCLCRAIAENHIDLVVLTTHGRGGHVDVTMGSIPTYLLTHAAAPLLIVREAGMTPTVHVEHERGRARLPGRATA
jgi:nucleotide-binding universal stress UspA family protein